MRSPFGASTVQLGIGAALLLALALLVGALGAFELLDDAEPWQLFGGVGSAVYITAGILLFPRLGAVVAVGMFIAGQILASLLLDGFGWLGVEREPVDAAAAACAVAVVVGALLIVRAQAGGNGSRAPCAIAAAGSGSPWSPARRCPSKAPSTLSCEPSSTNRSRSARSPSWSRPLRWRLCCW